MNPHAPTSEAKEPPLPAGLRTLWAEACEWAGWLLAVFAPNGLRTTGLSREQGAGVSLWLRNIEGAVRRLILGAALAFTPAAPLRTAPSRTQKHKPSQRHAVFRVFGFRSASTTKPTPTQPRAPKPYGHIAFATDPLLHLGPAAQSPQRTTRTPRTRNPLDRWGRLSRQDPDWRAPVEKPFRDTPEEDRFAWLFEDTTLDRRPPPKPRPARKPRDPEGFPDSLWDWRRCHDEWLKVVPAPHLAARIEALARVIANPAASIAGAARRLARPHNLGPRFVHQAFPTERIPRRLQSRTRPGLTADLIDRSHTALTRPDTS